MNKKQLATDARGFTQVNKRLASNHCRIIWVKHPLRVVCSSIGVCLCQSVADCGFQDKSV